MAGKKGGFSWLNSSNKSPQRKAQGAARVQKQAQRGSNAFKGGSNVHNGGSRGQSGQQKRRS